MKILAFDLETKDLGFNGTYFSSINPKAAYLTVNIGNAHVYSDDELEKKVKNIMEGCDVVCESLWDTIEGTKIAYISKDFLLPNMILATAKSRAISMNLHDRLSGKEMLEGINYCMKVIDLDEFIISRL